MSRKHRTVVALLLVALCVAALPAALTSALPARAAAADPTAGPPRPYCRLLDDPAVRARMSGAFEMALLEACGRAAPGPVPLPGAPVPAAALQGGPDVRVNGIDPPVSSTTQSETSIAVNPNTGTICSTYNDSYHYHIQGLGYCGFSRSIDGGQTFEDGGVMPPGGGGVSRGDPSVAWRQADGSFYFTCIHEAAAYSLGLWKSTDDCATFEWVGMVHTGGSDDKEFLAVDNNPSSPYLGRLYVAWTDFGAGGYIRLVRSDNGTSWSAPVTLSTSTSVQGAWPTVGPNGDVYVAWVRWTGSDLMSMEAVRSTNGGVSFSPITNPRSSVTVPYDEQASQNCFRDALNGNIRYLPSPQIAVGPDGCVHTVYSYDPDGHNVGDVVNSYYRRSCDNGTTWEPEVRLNDDDTLTDQFFPNVAVNDNNVVAASWYDRRLDPAGNLLFDRYRAISRDGGVTWEANERVSDVSSPVYINPQTSACYHGDYDQLAVDADWLYAQWSDDRVFFNGHQDPDVWFERQEIEAPVPDFSLDIAPASHQVCPPAVVISTVTLDAIGGYTQPVTLSDAGLPPEVTTAFSPNPVPVPGAAVYTITVGAEATAGDYGWAVTGEGPGQAHSVAVSLTVNGPVPAGPALLDPPDGATDVPTQSIPFTWSAVPDAAAYRIQVDDDPEFGSPEADVGGLVTTTYVLPGPLAYSTEYFWRVSAAAACDGPFSTPAAFTTRAPCMPAAITAFDWEPVAPLAGQVVTFTAESTGTAPLTFEWQWGDGASGAGSPAAHAYAAPGTYTVILTATNSCGRETATGEITVVAPPHRVYLPLVVRGGE